MIDYFYRGDYDDTPDKKHPANNPEYETPTTKAHVSIAMYNVADKYAVEPLMALAIRARKQTYTSSGQQGIHPNYRESLRTG